MGEGLILGVSLTASMLAGMMALFAPCCITFLFPAYLGTIFRSRGKVVAYTLVFALGLATILVPITLGVRTIVYLFDDYHTQVYYAGALVMILMGIMTLKPGWHLPQLFTISPKAKKQASLGSTYLLGMMSGLTSACCAPVLLAAATLTSLAPSLLQAVIVGGAYVMGIVLPLVILSLVYESATGLIGGKRRQKLQAILQKAGAGVFFLSGILVAVANYKGLIQMEEMSGYSDGLQWLTFSIASAIGNPWIDAAIFTLAGGLFLAVLRRSQRRQDHASCH